MTHALRIAQVAPVATSVPPPRSGSIESLTALLTDGLVAAGHAVTLFATGESRTRATLHPTFARGYREDPENWPWELCELINLSAAVERAAAFDVIHYQARYHPLSLPFGRLAAVPLVVTLHHAPAANEVALWARHYPDTPFVAISEAQRRTMSGLNVVGTVPHAIDVAAFPFAPEPRDYLLFLGRFMEGKGVLQAIDVARRTGLPLVLAAEANDYYHEKVAPFVDGQHVVYAGEVADEAKAALLGGARALLYPVQVGEPFGLVLAEATTCGTPVAALDRGAVREVVEDGVTGGVFDSLDALVAGLPRVLALDRARVRTVAAQRFSVERMVAGYADVYRALIGVYPLDSASGEPMNAAARDLEGRSLLAVFAHPDDESLAAGGLLACCAARGAGVSLLCLSRGEAGRGPSGCGAGSLDPADLGDIRERELRDAAAALGFSDVLLRTHADGMLPWLPADTLEHDIRTAIVDRRPDVVVTFGEDGLYWHPDHIATYEATRAAVARLDDSAPALFYVTMPPGQMRAVLDAAGSRLPAGARRDLLGIEQPDAFGASAQPPSLVFRSGRFAERKLAALRCHRSQVAGGPFDHLDSAEAEALLGVEHYRRADVGSTAPAFIEQLASSPLETTS